MYNNKYSVTWVLINAKKRAFTPSDKNIVTISVNDFNAYFMSATYAMTKNKKFVTIQNPQESNYFLYKTEKFKNMVCSIFS